MSNIVRVLFACVLLAGPLGLSPAIARVTHPSRITEADVSNLGPGGYIWSPEVAPDGPVKIVISLLEQRAYVYRNDVLIGVSEVSTGMDGRETPTGVFPILEKQVFHRSNKYDDAPMPYMQRLTWGGVALHGGKLPGYAASHGCIRLPTGFAKRLYSVTKLGTPVMIRA